MLIQNDVYAALAEIVSDVFDRDDIVLSPGLTAADVAGWDSFKQIEIIIACEERFGVKFRTRDLDSLTSLGALVTLIIDESK